MTAKIIRIGLIGCVVLMLSNVLPQLYRKAFEQKKLSGGISYSEVLDEFIETGIEYNPATMRDEPYGIGADGTRYNSDQVRQILPMNNYRQLVYEGRAPDTIRGVHVTLQKIEDNAKFPRFLGVSEWSRPYAWMFESVTDAIEMELPDDLFCMDEHGAHFINTGRNRVLRENGEKGRLFTDAMLAEGFVFPQKHLFGYVNTRKSQDDGYFIVDAQDGFYHLKMVDGDPFCAAIPLPPGMQVIGMNCMTDPDYYGYVYDRDYNIYLLKRGDYGFFQVPIYNYGAPGGLMLCYENLFFFTYTFSGGGKVWYYVMDKEHNLLASTSVEPAGYYDGKEGMRERYLFPFRTGFTRDTPAKLSVGCNPPSKFLWLNAALALALLVMQVAGRRNMRSVFNYIDVALVLALGLYGFIGVLVFPNRT